MKRAFAGNKTIGMMTVVALLIAPVLFLVFTAEQSATMATNTLAVPDYEVKVLLDPIKVLKPNNELTKRIRKYFGIPSSKTKMRIQYMDTAQLQIDEKGWNIRVRKLENFVADEFEITYKKRYPIANSTIDDALAKAASDGFASSDSDFRAEIDWGFEKRTLSFSNSKMVKIDGYEEMDLPSLEDSRNVLSENAPERFKNWDGPSWGTGLLERAIIYGPVFAKRWQGKWQGKKIAFEVWKIAKADKSGYDYIVEASFKSNDYADAGSYKEQLQQEMNQQGWLLPVDELKTRRILESYAPLDRSAG